MNIVWIFASLMFLALAFSAVAFFLAKKYRQKVDGNKPEKVQPVAVQTATQPTPVVKPAKSRWYLAWQIPLGILGLYTAGWCIYQTYAWWSKLTVQTASTNTISIPATVYVSENYTKEQKLAAIASCETDGCMGPGQMFEKDGKTPIRNREGVDAICTYQIRESVWMGKAMELQKQTGRNFDFHTKEGCENMANWIYDDDVQSGGKGTAAWETDSRGKRRWQAKLMGTESSLAMVEAGQGHYSDPVKIPDTPPGTWVYWESLDNKPYHFRIDRDDNKVYSSELVIKGEQILPTTPTREIEFYTEEEMGQKTKMRIFLSKKL